MDHPVALVAAGAEQRIAALQPLSVEDDDHLVGPPLLADVGAAVPDPDLAGTVVACRDLALEVDVLERVVLHVDRLAVALRVVGDAVRHRPRRQRPVVLQSQVPVQPPGVVFVDDEPLSLGGRRCRALGLGRVGEAPLAAVGGEVATHASATFPG